MENHESKWLMSLRQCQNAISGDDINKEKANEEMQNLLQLIKDGQMPLTMNQHLGNFLENVLCNTNLVWITSVLEDMKACQKSLVAELFFESPPECTFLALGTSLLKLSLGVRQVLCLEILESFFQQKRFLHMLLRKCCAEGQCISAQYANTLSGKIINLLNSLPERVANTTNGKFSDFFHHTHFFKFLAAETAEAFEKLAERVRSESNITVKFLAEMVGQFCVSGRAESFLGVLLPYSIVKTRVDFVWRSLMQKLFASLPERCLESTVLFVVSTLPWYGCMRWIFGDMVLHSPKFKFLLLHKFLLTKHFPTPVILKNILGYLADGDKTQHLVVETLEKLLLVWSDSSVLRHISYEQHRYITQGILICAGHLTHGQREQHKQDLIMKMMPGMSCHLDCPDASTRRLGMIVGEVLSAALDSEGKNKLEFEYQEDEETLALKKLTVPDQKPDDQYFDTLATAHEALRETFNKKCKDSGSVGTYTASKATIIKMLSPREKRIGEDGEGKVEEQDFVPSVEVEIGKPTQLANEDSDDDDEDDDLEPYDMSNDTVYSKVKKPVYIRDCLEGILQTENREQMEVCLSSAKMLIELNPVSAKEVSIEFCQALLLLEDHFALEGFVTWRHAAMTALAVVHPEKVAIYLTTEFYAENYTLSRRLDMLDVLASAAGALSAVDRGAKASVETQEKAIDQAETWREIIDRRIESKTRRFGKTKRRVSAPAKANRFGPVAGCFFYPLLAGYDKRVRTLDLLGRDSMVLGRLLYSVGTIVHSAANTTAVTAMARTLLEFVLNLRYHEEAYVRQATLFCVAMATLSAGNTLADSDVMLEVNDWISDVMANDENARTKELAMHTCMVVSSAMTKQLKT